MQRQSAPRRTAPTACSIVFACLAAIGLAGTADGQQVSAGSTSITVTIESPQPVKLSRTDPTRVKIKVDRKGRDGEITIMADGVPDGLVVPPPEAIAKGNQGELVITGAATLGDEPLAAKIRITASVAGMSADATCDVVMPGFELPAFLAPGTLVVQPGTGRTITLACDRKGHAGPIELAAADPPAGLRCSPISIQPHSDSADVTVDVEAGVPDGRRSVVFSGTFADRPLTYELGVDVIARPYHVAAARGVTLPPGGRREFDLLVERAAYSGPIEVAAVGLPTGVAMQPVIVSPGTDRVTAELSCADDAIPQLVAATIRSRGGGFTADSPLVVRIRGADDGRLPAVIGNRPETARLERKGSFAGRLSPANKRALGELYGGTASMPAVLHGLEWLARVQQQDGGWAQEGLLATLFESDRPAADPQAAGASQVAPPTSAAGATLATALGVLPFLAEGVSHARAPDGSPALAAYPRVVERALLALSRGQTQGRGADDGFFGGGIVGHCLATVAFAEDYGLTRNERVREHAKDGLKYLIATQDGVTGGWGILPHRPSSVIVTALVVDALRTAQLAGMGSSSRALEKGLSFVESCAAGPPDAPGSCYGDRPGASCDPLATAAGLGVRIALGWGRDEADLQAGVGQLTAAAPPEAARLLHDSLAMRVLRDVEGEEFDAWNHAVRERLLRSQRTDGELAGSWDPPGLVEGGLVGRVETTALALLTLQSHYRHLPMYRGVRRPVTATGSEAADADVGDDPAPGGSETP